MSGNYIKILEYLKNNGGERYKAVDKCKSQAEQDAMSMASNEGKNARALFTEMVDFVKQSYHLIPGKITQWQNSGYFVRYFWCQLKKEEYFDSNISLSLFAETYLDCVRFRASVELAVDKASQDEKYKFKKILELPLTKNLTYVSGGNNEDSFEDLDITDNKKVIALDLKKVQVSYVINEEQCISNEEIIKLLINGIGNLMEYYDYALQDMPQQPQKAAETVDVPQPIKISECIPQIKEYILRKGFSYQNGLIANFCLCLKSKPFVILAGTSGTGKTRLVKLFAEAIGAEYKLVSVRPDWSDGSDLFGHYDLNGKFIEGPVCECFKLAYEKPNKPVFLCLDEMNLARVEYYLSDFLSVIESREKDADGKVFTAQIAQYTNGIPDNLYIVGTVNMDETTFPFSKKVLDRANTIEFSYVDLMPSFIPTGSETESLQLPNSFLRTEYLVLNRDCASDQEYVSEICSELQAINKILAKANAHVGYRVRDEIVFYMLNNKVEGNLLSHEEAFDNEIMQKILPRIQGNSASVKDMLCDMFTVCASDYNQKTGDTDSEKMHKILSDGSINCRYRKSAEKLEMMVRRFEEDGFTSYWL